jgi:histone acetyltransferase 1
VNTKSLTISGRLSAISLRSSTAVDSMKRRRGRPRKQQNNQVVVQCRKGLSQPLMSQKPTVVGIKTRSKRAAVDTTMFPIVNDENVILDLPASREIQSRYGRRMHTIDRQNSDTATRNVIRNRYYLKDQSVSSIASQEHHHQLQLSLEKPRVSLASSKKNPSIINTSTSQPILVAPSSSGLATAAAVSNTVNQPTFSTEKTWSGKVSTDTVLALEESHEDPATSSAALCISLQFLGCNNEVATSRHAEVTIPSPALHSVATRYPRRHSSQNDPNMNNVTIEQSSHPKSFSMKKPQRRGSDTRTGNNTVESITTARLENPSNNLSSQSLPRVYGPVYTHQIFPGEYIRGYRPTLDRLALFAHEESEANAKDEKSPLAKESLAPSHWHPSYIHHHPNIPVSLMSRSTSEHAAATSVCHATRTLDVRVRIAPSGTRCDVSVTTERLANVVPATQRNNDVNCGDGHSKNDGRPSKRRRRGCTNAWYQSIDEEKKYDDGSLYSEGEIEDAADKDDDEEWSHDDLCSTSEGDESNANDEELEYAAASVSYHASDREGATRQCRMPISEIKERLAQALPPIDCDNTDEKTGSGGKRSTSRLKLRTKVPIEADYLENVVGTVIREYEIADRGTFVLSLATGSEAASYHSSVQKLALFFIETADGVDISDYSAGFWKVLYLFQKLPGYRDQETILPRSHRSGFWRSTSHSVATSSSRYALAGYMTLFHFRSLFRKPKPGIVLRVCQALVLPHYQRCGHGKHMLHAVYDIAHGEASPSTLLPRSRTILKRTKLSKKSSSVNDAIVEINVEDPAPAFTALRVLVDFERYQQSVAMGTSWFLSLFKGVQSDVKTKKHWPTILESGLPSIFDGERGMATLPDNVALAAANRAKITVRQIHIVYEMDRLQELTHVQAQRNCHLDTIITPTEVEELERQYRLLVKKRLNHEDRDEISLLRSKVDMQAELGRRFNKVVGEYRRLLQLPVHKV